MDIIERLIEQLGSDDEVIRVQAGEMLLQMGGAAVRPLIEALQKSRHPARHLIVSTLGYLGDKRAVEPLIQALNDKDKLVRLHAALALGKLKDKRAIQPLIHSLFDEMPPVGTDPLTNEPLTVRAAAAQALGELQAKEAVTALKVSLKDPNLSVRRAAIQALGQIETEEGLIALQEDLMRETDPLLCQLTVRAIERMSLPKAREVLQAIANKHSDPQVRALVEAVERKGETVREEINYEPSLPTNAPSSKRKVFPLLSFLGLALAASALTIALTLQWPRWLTVLAVIVGLLLPFGLWKLRRHSKSPAQPTFDCEPSLPKDNALKER